MTLKSWHVLMGAMNTNAVRLIAPMPRSPRVFAARWRDDETGQWQSVAVLALNAEDAREIVAELIGHYGIEIVRV